MESKSFISCLCFNRDQAEVFRVQMLENIFFLETPKIREFDGSEIKSFFFSMQGENDTHLSKVLAHMLG